MERYYPGDDHKSRVLLGDLRAQAYAWIEAYAESISPGEHENDGYGGSNDPVDAEEMIEAALSHQKEGWGDYISRGGTFEGFRVDPLFWDKFAIVAGIERDMVDEASFFTCSC